MNYMKVWSLAALLLICTAPVFAQEQTNEIRCSGAGTTCATNFIPKFATNGGSATVNDSIMSQSGTTISINGNESVGSITASSLSAGNITASGTLLGAFVEAITNTAISASTPKTTTQQAAA